MSTVTINRDPEPVFLFWRNPANLTLLHGPVTDVTPIDGRERWTIAGPGGVRGVLDMRLVEEVPLELLLWEAEGVGEGPWFSVELRAGPTRGTEVFVAARIPPPVPVRTARRLTGLLAQAELETMLRRARALLETGEFPTTEGQSSGRERVAPSGTPSVAER